MSDAQFEWAEAIVDVVEAALAGLPTPPPGVTDIRMGLEYDEDDQPTLWYFDWSTDHHEHWNGTMSRGGTDPMTQQQTLYKCPCQRCPRCTAIRVHGSELGEIGHPEDGLAYCGRCDFEWWVHTGIDHIRAAADDVLRQVYDIRAYNGVLP